jgi:RimJ/RimL family protein N-acetyltransferase
MDRPSAASAWGVTTLREVAASDVYPLFTLFSDPAVTAYMAPPPPTPAKFAGFVEWSHQQRAQGMASASESFLTA